MFRSWPRPLTAVIGLVICGFAGSALYACAPHDAETSSAGQFCAVGRDNQALIVAPPMSTQADVEAAIDFYVLMGELAPVDIADDWNALVTAMLTASELQPGDQQSEQLVAQTAYAMERSAYNVMVWFRDNCNVALPITTIVPHDSTSPAGQ